MRPLEAYGFAFVLLALLPLVHTSAALAQDAPPQPEPLAPEAAPPAAESAPPVVAPKTPPPDAKREGAPDGRANANANDGCGLWPGALGGLAGYGGSAAVGGLLFCVGGLMASIPIGGGSSDNCAEACVEAAAAAFFVAIGVVIAVGGIIALGPIAAVAATIGAAAGSAGAERKVWPSIVGGSLGILVSIAGLGVTIYGLDNSPTVPFVAGTPFNAGDQGHVAMVAGVGLAAASGLVSIGAALGADAMFGGPAEP